MLSHKILTRQDIGRAASYYKDGADDYYSKDCDASQWQGKGAKALNLSGEVDSLRFRQLLSGLVNSNAKSNTRMATRHDSKQRIGIDLAFSAPKSVSIQALVGIDGGIIKAHDMAVERAMTIAEMRAQARKKINGKSFVETTGNLIVGKFRHETSREQDPHLHTHAVVTNLTQRKDGKWRALMNDEIIKMSKYLGAVYRSELALELQKLGYQIRHERDGMFELAHISRQQLVEFSSRSKQIEDRLASQGITRETATTSQKQQATMQSRAPKVSTEREQIFKEWCKKAKELGIDFKGKEWVGEHSDSKQSHKMLIEQVAIEAAKRSVKFAVSHLTERQSVINERTLFDTAMKHAVGSARLMDIEQEIKSRVEVGTLIKEACLYASAGEQNPSEGKTKQAWIEELKIKGFTKSKAREQVSQAITQGRLIPLEPRYTTQAALDRERSILKIERESRNSLTPILKLERLATHPAMVKSNLNSGQLQAVQLITTTTNRVVGVQGFADTGKSHMLKAAKALIEKEGYQMRALAPYGSQVKALRELGVESNTLASFLRAKDKNINEKTVLVIDEAGVVPTRLMEQVLRLAQRNELRVVLMGDIAQTKAIEGGRPFDQLQSEGMATAHMTEIQRQKDPLLKDAVILAAKGESEVSLQKIASILEFQQDEQRHRRIVQDYGNLSQEEREQTIIVSGTNEARREINKMIREDSGRAGQGVELDTLIRRDTTQAERKFSKHYHVGDVIQPEKDYKKIGLQRGELYKVEDTGPGNRLKVVSESGTQIQFNPMTCQKISVYQPERAELSIGDLVRITRNDAKLDIANGDRMKVESIEKDALILSDGKRQLKFTIDKPLHLDYAYATTVHSSQGLTSERVLIDIKTNSPTTSKDVYYVAISRARKEARIYTDNRQNLPEAISRENLKLSALDLILETGRKAKSIFNYVKKEGFNQNLKEMEQKEL